MHAGGQGFESPQLHHFGNTHLTEATLTLHVSLKEFDLLAAHSQTTDSDPVRETGRITSLYLIRGVAVLGILLMNAVYFKLGPACPLRESPRPASYRTILSHSRSSM